ncbi:RPM1 interacting protein 13 [Cardamine amara subsp. amara]|uniref:RPM1 interacting protein 13 n=1 Tax=Cardamine amara subsp. amara TaxID=228776 RepID=A0ABD1AAG6_CARAN
MAIKETETVEKSSSSGWKKMSEKRKRIGKERDANKKCFTAYSGLLRLQKRQDMKIVQEQDECTILDFNPEEGELSSTADSPESDVDDDDDDVSITNEKGEVASHPRHLCSKFPFESTKPEKHCKQCYCFVCECAAPCPHWTCGYAQHCDAIDDERWRHVRMYHQNLFEQLAASEKKNASNGI